MTRVRKEFGYEFFPVGQGLFSSGLITQPEGWPWFSWVYDCGTSSSQSLIDDGIARLRTLIPGTRHLHILTISHFDNDHISGVCRVLSQFRIDTLLLPYVPLDQRIAAAFAEGLSPDDALWEFFVNPVSYLVARATQGIRRILFVPGSGTDGPPIPPDQNIPDGPTNVRDEPEVDYPSDDPSKFEELSFRPVAGGSANLIGAGPSIEFLRSGGAISIDALWEFVPYNDAPKVEIPSEFLSSLQAESKQLLDATTNIDRQAALQRLKAKYDEHFGKSSEARNEISLFLYSGPIYRNWKEVILVGSPHFYPVDAVSHFPLWRSSILPVNAYGYRNKCSMLYTGDGYLDTPARLNALVSYLGPTRIKTIGVCQVMHHGAKLNWHQGVAKAISPTFSIFSSDPEWKNLHHPHAPVLRDFWPFGAAQVDKTFGFVAVGELRL